MPSADFKCLGQFIWTPDGQGLAVPWKGSHALFLQDDEVHRVWLHPDHNYVLKYGDEVRLGYPSDTSPVRALVRYYNSPALPDPYPLTPSLLACYPELPERLTLLADPPCKPLPACQPVTLRRRRLIE